MPGPTAVTTPALDTLRTCSLLLVKATVTSVSVSPSVLRTVVSSREAEAHGLWRQGRKEETLRASEDVLRSGGAAPSWRALWYVGRLAFELGRLDQAERAFRALWEWDGPPAYLYLGRIYERTGRSAEALDAYEFVIYAWRNADPELRPMVDEARRAVTRLSGA